MSRIEKALEKAMELRESQRRETPPPEPQASGAAAALEQPLPEIEETGGAVDRGRVDKHIVCITEPNSQASEQYRRLRARLLMATKKDFLNTIMVTSSSVGEGKTLTAVNLAVALAGAYDNTVLLVEADLRRPSICKYLGIEPGPGLSDCLAGKAEMKDAIIKTGIGRLSVLPAGNSAERPAELLSSEKMKLLVAEMKTRYKDRYVIFDSSPVLATADALSLGSMVDGVLLVVKADETSERALGQAVSLMRGCNVLGAVLNNMPPRLARAAHPYYGGYSYYQGHETGGQEKRHADQ